MLNYYVMSFQNALDFNGRATRAEYWWAYLGHIIVSIVLTFLFGNSGGAITGLYSLVMTVVMLSLGVRRMHDVGTSGWVILIPIVNLVYLVKGSKY